GQRHAGGRRWIPPAPSLHLRSDRGSFIDDGDVRNEAVTAPSHSLHEPRARRRITQRLPNPVDRFVHPVVEIDEGLGGPQPVAKLFPGHRLAAPFEQHREKLKRLLLKSEPHAVLSQLAGSLIDLEYDDTKVDSSCSLCYGNDYRQFQRIPT